jgi:hypothetical protein
VLNQPYSSGGLRSPQKSGLRFAGTADHVTTRVPGGGSPNTVESAIEDEAHSMKCERGLETAGMPP